MKSFLFAFLIVLFITLSFGYRDTQAADKGLIETIQKNFKDPPSDCWPHTRWWWPGNPVSKETITWHLEQMKTHGIRGVEQISMGAYYEKGNIPFLSEEFIEMLKHMVKEAKRLEMEVSINFGGPGWIIGGEWVPENERSKDIVPTSVVLNGPLHYSGSLPDTLTRTRRSWEIYKPRLESTEKLLAVVAGRIHDQQIVTESLVVLTDKVKNGKIDWQVPAGQWRLMAFWLMRNDHDHAVDHFSAKAMRNYCNTFGGILHKAFAEDFGETVESMFVDSFELPNSASGIYWSDYLLEKYTERMGYDLTPYLPAIWWTVGELSPKIRYDVNKFLHQMGLDVFYGEFVGWCNRNGLKSRIQTYGFTTDNIESAGRADIPEMEITAGEKDAADWFDTRIGPKKYVASGAHIYGKEVVSSEVYTFIHWERYRATLEELKIASDVYLKYGTTKFYNHGYSFTPESDIAPSRSVGFAANISPTNVWWDHYPLLAAYIARCSYLLRQGDFVADIAVYSPLANQWTLDVLNARKWTREFDWGDLGELLLANGYDFDLLNDDALQNLARTEEGMIKISKQSYKILILPAIKAIPLETMKFIQGHIRQGGIVIALERVPEKSTGFINYEKNDADLAAISKELFEEPFGRDKVGTVDYGQGHTHFIKMVLDRKIWWDVRSSTLDPFLNTIRKYVQPDVAIDFAFEGMRKNNGIMYLHRRINDADIYFISNIQDRASTIPLTFRVTDKQVWNWDPYTGDIRRIFHYQQTDKGIKIPLKLAPYESTILVFEKKGQADYVGKTNFSRILDMDDDKIVAEAEVNGFYQTKAMIGTKPIDKRSTVSDIPAYFELNGQWHLSLTGQGFSGMDTSFQHLFSWTDVPFSTHFSGTGAYSMTFELPDDYLKTDLNLYLDLGKIGEIAEIIVNEKQMGIVWMRGIKTDITNAVRQGKNHLRVNVTNLSINRVSGFSKNPPIPKDLVARFGENDRNGLPREYGFKPLPPSGLMGPVRIIPAKKVDIAIGSKH